VADDEDESLELWSGGILSATNKAGNGASVLSTSLVLVVEMERVCGVSFSHGFRGEGITDRGTPLIRSKVIMRVPPIPTRHMEIRQFDVRVASYLCIFLCSQISNPSDSGPLLMPLI
jgi:hypothetical protein